MFLILQKDPIQLDKSRGRSRFSSSYSFVRAIGAFLIGLMIFGYTLSAWAHEGEEDKSSGQELSVFSEEEQEIIDLLNQYTSAFEAKDISQIEQLVVADEGFSHIEGTFMDVGWASYRGHLEPEMAMFGDSSYSLDEIRPYVSGDLAFATFQYEMNVVVVSEEFEGGKHPVSMRGRATVVLTKVEGDWKIRHMHTARESGATNSESSDH